MKNIIQFFVSNEDNTYTAEGVNNKYLVITVVGSHAGENVSEIFIRKQKEKEIIGSSYWLVNSFKAKTDMIQNLCMQASREGKIVHCIFIGPSQNNATRPTIDESVARYISQNSKDWKPVPDGIKITGKITRNSTALVIDDIYLVQQPISFDLWGYSEFGTRTPIKLQLGASTICCEKLQSIGMQSRFRNVLATGKLSAPYAVWVK